MDEYPMPKGKDRYWTDQFAGIAREISMLAIACDIDVSLPDISKRILNNDEGVCRKNNPAAFKKIKGHLMALYPLEERALDRLGPDETKAILEGVWQEVLRLSAGGGPDEAN